MTVRDEHGRVTKTSIVVQTVFYLVLAVIAFFVLAILFQLPAVTWGVLGLGVVIYLAYLIGKGEGKK